MLPKLHFNKVFFKELKDSSKLRFKGDYNEYVFQRFIKELGYLALDYDFAIVV